MKYSWSEFDRDCKRIARWAEPQNFFSIYGIPRGGMVIGVKVSHLLDIPITDAPHYKTLVVDDICDTGRTLSKYSEFQTATLFYKDNKLMKPNYHVHENKEWIIFPWETKKTSKMDYLR